jgi:glutamate synthase domain-containing protein 3
MFDLGSKLKGKEKVPIKLRIDGNVGRSFGDSAQYLDSTVYGNADSWCYSNAEHSRLAVYGNTGFGCGASARYSEFLVTGHIGGLPGVESSDCSFSIHDKTDFRKTVRTSKRSSMSNCNIILLDKDGEELRRETV